MKMKYFDLAKKMAKKSNHPQHKIGGCVVSKSKIVSVGFNKYKTHAKSNHPFQHVHCELDCILGIEENLLKDCTIYLYRETKNGTVAISKPCIWCDRLLKNVGIKSVCYTDNNSFKEDIL
jgi:deoxycytidylate deaminase